MKRLHSLAWLLPAAAAVILSACKDDDDPASLSLSARSLEFGAAETAAKEVTVTTDAAVWKASADREWITVTPAGNTFSVTVSENTLPEDRTGTVTVTASGAAETVSVLQHGRNLNTLTVEPESLRFSGYGNEKQQVTVTTDADAWSAEPGADWITVSTDADILTVTVPTNPLYEERAATITVKGGDASFELPVTQDGKARLTTEIKIFFDLMGSQFNRVSTNGRYAIGFVSDNLGFRYDISTGTQTTILGPEGTVEKNQLLEGCETTDIADDGTMVGTFRSPDAVLYHKDENGNQLYDDSGNPVISNPMVPGVYRNGMWTELERRDDLIPLWGEKIDGWATAVTADGRYAVGAVHMPGGQGWGLMNACIWDNSTGKLKQQYDGCTQGQGGNPYNCSDDGTKAVGWVDRGDNIRRPAVWINGSMTSLDDPGEMCAVSPNGKYFGGTSMDMPVLWTPAEGLKEVPVHLGQYGGAVTAIADDGTAVGYSFDDWGTTRLPFIITPDGTFHDLVEYMEDVYGYTRPADLLPPDLQGVDLSTYMFVPMDISADGKVICGYSALFEPWIITLGEPTAE